MNTLSIAVIGNWGHTVDVLTQLEMLPHVRFVGVGGVFPGDDFSAWRTRFGKLADVPHFEDYRQLLDRERPDVAIIGTRLDRISVIATEAAEAGCQLICEKPLAGNIHTLRALRAVVRSRRAACIGMLANADQQAFLAAREAVTGGLIGSIVQVQVRKTYKWGSRPEWFGDATIYPGTIPWVGIHGFDILNFVTGLKPMAITARHGNAAHPSHPGCQDHAELLVELAGGTAATMNIDYLRPESAATHGDDYIRISGSAGEIEAFANRGERGVCQLVDSQGVRNLPLPSMGHTYEDYIAEVMARRQDLLDNRTDAAFRVSYWSLLGHLAAETARRQRVEAEAS